MKTNTHPGDYDRRPRNAAKEYSFPTCPKCGEPTLPSMTDSNRAHCPKCGDVALCMVPATHLEEMREEIRKAGLLEAESVSVQTAAVYGELDLGTRFIVSGGEVTET
jgi:rRNA maturation protein Nop10